MNLKKLLIDLENVAIKSFDNEQVDSLLAEMLKQIGTNDGELRDRLIYGTFCRLLDEKLLSREVTLDVLEKCLSVEGLFYKIGESECVSVFTRSFSSLFVAAILYDEATNTLLDEEQYSVVLDNILQYMDKEQDIRGYVEDCGWAHAIAHGADALGCLASHPRATNLDRMRILGAIKLCLLKGGTYTNNEESRLARIVITSLKEGLEEAKVLLWLDELLNEIGRSQPTPYIRITGKAAAYFWHVANAMNFMKALYFRLKLEGSSFGLRADLFSRIETFGKGHHWL